jgi:hypothetical protein
MDETDPIGKASADEMIAAYKGQSVLTRSCKPVKIRRSISETSSAGQWIPGSNLEHWTRDETHD